MSTIRCVSTLAQDSLIFIILLQILLLLIFFKNGAPQTLKKCTFVFEFPCACVIKMYKFHPYTGKKCTFVCAFVCTCHFFPCMDETCTFLLHVCIQMCIETRIVFKRLWWAYQLVTIIHTHIYL